MMQRRAPTSRAESGGFTGWHMLFAMLAFFGVIVAVNLTMAMLASRSWTGLVVKNSYVASQDFNEQLATIRDQRRRGWNSELTYADALLTFRVRDRSGALLSLDEVVAIVGRPVAERDDQKIVLKPFGRGRYSARRELAPGTWSVRIEARRGNEVFRRDSRLIVSARGAEHAD